MERQFGRAPVGLWPSEGSVSDEALSLAAEAGFEWAASDNGVLARTIHQDGGPEVTYRSYLWQQKGRELRMIFRDHFLSDQVGFVYSQNGRGRSRGAFSGSHSREHAAAAGARRGRAGSDHSGWRERLGILRSQRPAISARAVPADQRIVRSGGADGQRGACSWIRRGRSITSIRDRGSTRISTSGSARKKTTSLGNTCCGRGGNSMKWRPAFPKSSAT